MPTMCLCVYLPHALRDELEEMLAPFLGRLDIVLRKALEESGGAALRLIGAVLINVPKHIWVQDRNPRPYSSPSRTSDSAQVCVKAWQQSCLQGMAAEHVWECCLSGCAWVLRHCCCWESTLRSTMVLELSASGSGHQCGSQG